MLSQILPEAMKHALEKAQAQLGSAAFQAALDEGHQMTMERALALATESDTKLDVPPTDE